MTAEEYAESANRSFKGPSQRIHDRIVINAFNAGKQEAEMGFAEWTSRNQWAYSFSEKNWFYRLDVTKTKTTPQLYQQWLSENNQHNK